MSSVTLKDIPADIHRAIKARARAHGRSLNREILGLLEDAVRPTVVPADTTIGKARAVRESMPVYLTRRDLDAFKAEGRR